MLKHDRRHIVTSRVLHCDDLILWVHIDESHLFILDRDMDNFVALRLAVNSIIANVQIDDLVPVAY